MPERFKVVCIPRKALYKCFALPLPLPLPNQYNEVGIVAHLRLRIINRMDTH